MSSTVILTKRPAGYRKPQGGAGKSGTKKVLVASWAEMPLPACLPVVAWHAPAGCMPQHIAGMQHARAAQRAEAYPAE